MKLPEVGVVLGMIFAGAGPAASASAGLAGGRGALLGNWICKAGGRVRPVVAVGVRGCEECDLRRLRILTCQREACAEGAEWNKKRPLIPRLDHGPQMLRVGEEVERSLEFYRDVLR